MQTEFTCGICHAIWLPALNKWVLKVNNADFGIIHVSGDCIYYTTQHYVSQETLLEISVLMNNIKRQYKQLNNG